MNREETRDEHESYGMIQVSRHNHSQGTYLFGSPVTDHFATFSITISTGYSYEGVIGTGEQRFMSGKRIVQIEMSPAQFLEMVTNQNTGCGVPCTITHRIGDDGKLSRMADPPKPKTDTERAHDAFEARMGAFGKRLDALIADVETACAKLPKKDQAALQSAARSLHTEVASNIPFFLRTFHEAAQRIVDSKKREVEAWMAGVIQRAGLAHLRQLAPGAVTEQEAPALTMGASTTKESG